MKSCSIAQRYYRFPEIIDSRCVCVSVCVFAFCFLQHHQYMYRIFLCWLINHFPGNNFCGIIFRINSMFFYYIERRPRLMWKKNITFWMKTLFFRLDQNLHTKHIIKTFFCCVWLSLFGADWGSEKSETYFRNILRFVIFSFHDDLFQSNFVTYKLICKLRGRMSYDVKSIPARAEFKVS